MRLQTECHYFVISAYKVIEYKKWVLSLGLLSEFDFSELDQFSESDIRDLRNMREHVVEYFIGKGHNTDRWEHTGDIDGAEFVADASSCINNLIGGRLDWVAFSQAAARILPLLLREPIPYPRS